MPRKARIDAAGAVHHIIARGIERGTIFGDDLDRNRFIERLSRILTESATQCYAWALVPNHFHLLLKTGNVPVRAVMQKLLTGYAVSYNRRHDRSGHLFQNRYKSILCQEEPYLLELVRYIHLNPIKAGIVPDIEALGRFPYCGHGALMGILLNEWQNTKEVLLRFSSTVSQARKRYRAFIEEGLSREPPDLTGGGLIRSCGGWEEVIARKREGVFQKSDERILGDDEFVTRVLQEQRQERPKITREAIITRICELLQCEKADIFSPGKRKDRVYARSLFCYWSVRESGTSQTELSRLLKLSPAGITKSVRRGEALVKEKGYSFK